MNIDMKPTTSKDEEMTGLPLLVVDLELIASKNEELVGLPRPEAARDDYVPGTDAS